MTLSPPATAFEGFRIIRDRPGLVLAWTGFYLLCLVAMILILLVPNIGTLAAVEGGSGQRDLDQLLARFGAPILFVIPIAVAMPLMLVTAVYRAVLQPQDTAFAHLKIGADELRVLGMSVVVIVIFALASGLYGIAVVAAANRVGPLHGVVTFAGSIGGAALLAWLMVRLSLAGTMTFAEHHLRLGAAWRLTRGHFWRLLTTLVLSLVYAVIVVVMALSLSFLLAMVTGGFTLLGELASPDLTDMTPGFALAVLGQLLLQLAINTLLIVLVLVIFYAPPAAAYRQLKGI